jgi:hypothetical protein
MKDSSACFSTLPGTRMLRNRWYSIYSTVLKLTLHYTRHPVNMQSKTCVSFESDVADGVAALQMKNVIRITVLNSPTIPFLAKLSNDSHRSRFDKRACNQRCVI